MSMRTGSLPALLLFLTGLHMHGQTSAPSETPDLREQVVALRSLVETLQARVGELEKRLESKERSSAVVPNQAAPPQTAAVLEPQSASPDLLHGTTVNILFDGYYGYNFNNPVGRVNYLRAYDISSNAFSLNQADLVLENAADLSKNKRFGIRLDLQFGQATATLQGNPLNEPRPGIYRNVFQAYGTYIFPVGKGLTVDFGKFASSLGMEGNYTKDQMNYSRAYWFNYLPFYHMGVRVNYKASDKVALNYWVVNGTNWTEAFNGFKDQYFGVAVQPSKKINWTVGYYLGQEHADVMFFPDGNAPAGLPTEQGVPFQPLFNTPTGKLHILDSYLTWQLSPRLLAAIEGDYVVQRLLTTSAPLHTDGGAGYLQFQLSPRTSIAGRVEYLSDRGGMFTGVTGAFKEVTATVKRAMGDNVLVFGEWRRDFANRPYFLTDMQGVFRNEQNTATIGLVWWVGGKRGNW